MELKICMCYIKIAKDDKPAHMPYNKHIYALYVVIERI